MSEHVLIVNANKGKIRNVSAQLEDMKLYVISANLIIKNAMENGNRLN